jgi:hypothetical protein
VSDYDVVAVVGGSQREHCVGTLGGICVGAAVVIRPKPHIF